MLLAMIRYRSARQVSACALKFKPSVRRFIMVCFERGLSLHSYHGRRDPIAEMRVFCGQVCDVVRIEP